MKLDIEQVSTTFIEKDLPKPKKSNIKQKDKHNKTEDMVAYHKDWYDRKFRGKKITVNCDCGKEVAYHYFNKHLKTDMHKRRMLIK
jgi:hypothetical protein